MKEMQTIVFLGSRKSGTSREAVRTAKELGCHTVLVTDRHRLEIPEADEIIYMPNLFEKEDLLHLLKSLESGGNKVSACMSFIDPFVSYAARISEGLGLGDFSSDALSLAENKADTRKKLKELNSSPFFSVIENLSNFTEFSRSHVHALPLILKPVVSNGSKDIKLVKTEEEMAEALLFFSEKYGEQPVLAEEYLDGPQYLIEVAVYKGEISIIAVIEQEWNESFIINGYSFPAEISSEEANSLRKAVRDILELIGLRQGSCHLEMRNVKNTWKLIEINPRMSGGWMNKIIETGTGLNPLKELLQMQLGEVPDFHAVPARSTYARYLTLKTAGRLLYISGLEKAQSLDGVEYVHVTPEPGSIVMPAKSMGERYACIITSAETIQKAKDIARHAAKELKFYLEPL